MKIVTFLVGCVGATLTGLSFAQANFGIFWVGVGVMSLAFVLTLVRGGG